MINIIGTPKKSYLPLHLQPIYRVSQILMILYLNANKKYTDISLLQMVAWAMLDKKNMRTLLQQKQSKSINIPGAFEPALERALIITLVSGYCIRSSSTGKIKITEKGKKTIHLIFKENLFTEQIALLKNIGDLSQNFN